MMVITFRNNMRLIHIQVPRERISLRPFSGFEIGAFRKSITLNLIPYTYFVLCTHNFVREHFK